VEFSLNPPAILPAILYDTEQVGFKTTCEPLTGSILRTLTASKPAGHFLEIGTGTGAGTCWIMDGMDRHSTLITVENNPDLSAIAQCHLGRDPRVEFVVADAEVFLKGLNGMKFDLIFADTFPGKFYVREESLTSLKIGGLYIIDDMLPQPTWPENHQANVDQLIAALSQDRRLRMTQVNWSSGLMVAVRVA